VSGAALTPHGAQNSGALLRVTGLPPAMLYAMLRFEIPRGLF
jgi:hypothetical protein